MHLQHLFCDIISAMSCPTLHSMQTSMATMLAGTQIVCPYCVGQQQDSTAAAPPTKTRWAQCGSAKQTSSWPLPGNKLSYLGVVKTIPMKRSRGEGALMGQSVIRRPAAAVTHAARRASSALAPAVEGPVPSPAPAVGGQEPMAAPAVRHCTSAANPAVSHSPAAPLDKEPALKGVAHHLFNLFMHAPNQGIVLVKQLALFINRRLLCLHKQLVLWCPGRAASQYGRAGSTH